MAPLSKTPTPSAVAHIIHTYDNLRFWTPYDFEAKLTFGDYNAYLLKAGTELFSYDYKRKLKLEEPTIVVGLRLPLEYAKASEQCSALFGVPAGADEHAALRQASLLMHTISSAFERGYALSGKQMKAVMEQKSIPATPRLQTPRDI